ncbi:MAG: response regulator [Polyangia bacterium]|nr:response regulator [Polyangia bacterium]
MPNRNGAEPKATHTRILVVDDQRDMREFLADVLCAAGYDALVVPDGLEAMRVIGADPEDPDEPPFLTVDVVVTDLRMPVADGMDVLEAVRRSCPWVRTILLTAFATPEVRLEAERLGADAVLSKPFSLAELLGTLEEVLSRAR